VPPLRMSHSTTSGLWAEPVTFVAIEYLRFPRARRVVVGSTRTLCLRGPEVFSCAPEGYIIAGINAHADIFSPDVVGCVRPSGKFSIGLRGALLDGSSSHPHTDLTRAESCSILRSSVILRRIKGPA